MEGTAAAAIYGLPLIADNYEAAKIALLAARVMITQENIMCRFAAMPNVQLRVKREAVPCQQKCLAEEKSRKGGL